MGSGKNSNDSGDTVQTAELRPVNENDTAELKTTASVPGLARSERHEPDRLSTGVYPQPAVDPKYKEPVPGLGTPLAELSRPPKARLATRVSLGLLVFGLGFYSGLSWHKLPVAFKQAGKSSVSQDSNSRKPASQTPPKHWSPQKVKSQQK